MACRDMTQLKPTSCDTFVALPPATANGEVIFGKNSDRPHDEVQDVQNVPEMDHEAGEKLKCTYIEIDQVNHTHAVLLSRPAWLWGAEMGANQFGVCIGNEAVWTKDTSEDDLEPRLLGMDLVRLGLERSRTSEEAVTVISELLEHHGQGGPCFEHTRSSYHNSFLICDYKDAWILETAGRHWAAEHVQGGIRNISNQLTIRTRIDRMSDGLQQHAEAKGWWSVAKDGPFDFAKAYSEGFEETELKKGVKASGRQLCGLKLLRDFSAQGKFAVTDMMKILRDEESGICMTGGFTSTASQVSVLPSGGGTAYHLLTGTPNPAVSIFKPFIFCVGAATGENTLSKTSAGGHALYTAHSKLRKKLSSRHPIGTQTVQQMHELESFCLSDVQELVAVMSTEMDDVPTAATTTAASQSRAGSIFSHMVALEMNFYSAL